MYCWTGKLLVSHNSDLNIMWQCMNVCSGTFGFLDISVYVVNGQNGPLPGKPDTTGEAQGRLERLDLWKSDADVLWRLWSSFSQLHPFQIQLKTSNMIYRLWAPDEPGAQCWSLIWLFVKHTVYITYWRMACCSHRVSILNQEAILRLKNASKQLRTSSISDVTPRGCQIPTKVTDFLIHVPISNSGNEYLHDLTSAVPNSGLQKGEIWLLICGTMFLGSIFIVYMYCFDQQWVVRMVPYRSQYGTCKGKQVSIFWTSHNNVLWLYLVI